MMNKHDKQHVKEFLKSVDWAVVSLAIVVGIAVFALLSALTGGWPWH